jgi:hypothetical protein
MLSDDNPEYIYITCYNDIKKNRGRYLPLINDTNIIVEELLDCLIIIYLKSTKQSSKTGFYGYFYVKNIITKKKYKENYNKLVSTFNMCEIDNLYFISYENIILLPKLVSITEINASNQNIKLHNTLLYNVIMFNVSNIINIITNITNINCNENISTDIVSNQNNNEVEEIIEMNIPILWIPCKNLIKIFNEAKLFKKILEMHYKKCEKCEINNNNRIDPDFNKKIMLKELEIIDSIKTNTKNLKKQSNVDCIESGTSKMITLNNKKEIATIINCYQTANKFNDTRNNFNLYEYDETKINIVYYKNTEHIYNTCMFIISEC